MNKHIELVKKWLKDKDSVSLEKLEANKEAADAYYEAAEAVYYAAKAAYAATNAAINAADDAAAYWVKRYEELNE